MAWVTARTWVAAGWRSGFRRPGGADVLGGEEAWIDRSVEVASGDRLAVGEVVDEALGAAARVGSWAEDGPSEPQADRARTAIPRPPARRAHAYSSKARPGS